MQIIRSRPPNFDEIFSAFPGAAGFGVIFAYAPNIYAPGGNVAPALVVHEEVHIARQQKIGVDAWWGFYISDERFRYEEELLAHRAEYQYMIRENSSSQSRRSALRIVAKKLIAPLYGYKVSMEKAMEDLSL